MSLSLWLPDSTWLSLLFFGQHVAAEVAQCYYPNGNLTTDSSVFVCDPRAKFSSCCYTGDMCTTNGFCKDVQNDATNNLYYRDLCTDSTWTSPKCPSYCDTMRTAGQNASSENRKVLACSQTTYCCAYLNNDTKSCCDDATRTFDAGSAAYLAGPQAHTSMFPATMSKATATGTATTSPTSSSAETGATSNSGGLSTGAKAGIGVGVALGAIAVASIVALVLLRRSRKKSKYAAMEQKDPETTEKQSHLSPPVYQDGSGLADTAAQPQKTAHIVEADGHDRGPVEMSATQTRQELPA